MKVNIEQFRWVINAILDGVERGGVDSIEIDTPFYWTVAEDDLRNTELETKLVRLNIGSLADDWELLSKNIGDENAYVPYQLTEVAPLLKYIGEKLAACQVTKD